MANFEDICCEIMENTPNCGVQKPPVAGAEHHRSTILSYTGTHRTLDHTCFVYPSIISALHSAGASLTLIRLCLPIFSVFLLY